MSPVSNRTESFADSETVNSPSPSVAVGAGLEYEDLRK